MDNIGMNGGLLKVLHTQLQPSLYPNEKHRTNEQQTARRLSQHLLAVVLEWVRLL